MTTELDVLTRAYTEPQRKFHTLEHIAFIFNTARDHGIKLTNAQTKAIWWHDAVYVPGSAINENDSIILFKNTVKMDDDKEFLRVVDMIWDTKHDREPRTEESAIVCDLDMFGFAADWSYQERLNKQIYDEFSFVPRDLFRQGRIKFLKGVLDTPIYYSETFKPYAKIARYTIEHELEGLED